MKAKYICRHCEQKKAPTLFPRDNAYECFSCLETLAQATADAEDTAPEIRRRTPGLKVVSPPPPEAVLAPPQAAGEVFVPPPPESVDPGYDPKNPSAKVLAQRTAARRSLMAFIRRYKPKYKAGWVHEDICSRLERFVGQVEQGLEPRLLLMMPVRHGKSEIASRHFAPWVLGRHPDWEIIAASGAQSLAMSFSRYIRDLVRDPSFSELFPTMSLDPSSQSVENWNTTYGGGYLAAGIGTMITGRGAHILVIDDPVKDAEAADSQVIRDATWEWYMSTALTRLAPGGGVLGIMTWWSEDDWAGRIQQVMATGDGDKFEIVKYPAINDQGDEYILPDGSISQFPPGTTPPEGSRLTRKMNSALHPERYTLEMLLRRKANYYALGQQRWWAALYQQNPAPEEGAFFTKDMFIEYTHPPRREGLVVYQAWDFAITEKQKSDWTVCITGMVDEYDTLYIMDVWRFKTEDGVELGTAIMSHARTWRANLIAVEDGQIWKSIKANFMKACEEARFYPAHEVIVPLTDKRTRAQPARGRMQQKKIQFPSRQPWYQELRTEMLRFEAGGRHDDQVDALAHLVRLVTTKAAPPPARKAQSTKSWKDKLNALINASGGSHMAA